MTENTHKVAVWIGCGDKRLGKWREEFKETLGLAAYMYTPAGGALALVFDAIDPDGTALKEVQKYVAVGQPELFVVEAHLDCGAVKKLLGRTFPNEAEERVFLLDGLVQAKKFLERHFPGKQIVGVVSSPNSADGKALFNPVF